MKKLEIKKRKLMEQVLIQKLWENEREKLRKLIKKNYHNRFKSFFNFIKNIGLLVAIGTVILLAYGLFVLIILRPMILAILIAFAIAFTIIKRLSETPTSKFSK